jgi:DNA-binding transcriptional LysR family regulator
VSGAALRRCALLAHRMTAFLPDPLCRFLVAYPDLSVDLEERPSVEIALTLAEDRADLGVAADIADLAALETRPLAEDRLVVVASAKHRVAGEPSVAFSDIESESFIGVSDAALEIYLGERASRLGRQLNYRVRLRRVQDVGMLAGAGVGIAILSESSIAELDRPGLAILPLKEAWAHRHLYLCTRDFRALTPHANLLAQYLAQEPQNQGRSAL